MKRRAAAVLVSAAIMIFCAGCAGTAVNNNHDGNDGNGSNSSIESREINGNIEGIESNVSQPEPIEGKSISAVATYDLDGDGTFDKAELLLDGLDVVLAVNGVSIKVFDVTDEQQIFGENPSDHFYCELKVCGNKIAVGRTYVFTNKYGSTAEIDCFEYKPGRIDRIFSAPSDSRPQFTVVEYNSDEGTIEMDTGSGIRKIILSGDEKNDYESFSSGLEKMGYSPAFEYAAMPEYRMIENDSGIEIIARGIVTCGACPVTEVYYQKYQLSGNGLIEKDSWFGSEKPELAEDYGFE
ncbi:MAG: hypothetical protein GXX04_10525 [Clostridiaceae bacterium]|nr:hypothetical protein [Clostridiaceae bacterium]